MDKLTVAKAKRINDTMVTEEHLKLHAAKCDRSLILRGCEMLGMDVKAVAEIAIEGMKLHAEELGLAGN